MTPPPSNPEPSSAPTLDPTEAPRAKPQTRASDLDASDAGVQTSAVSPDRAAASGRYVLTAFHARGGMGEVWRCQDATLGREVALKRLVSDRSAARDRFLAEAQVTGQLQHPGIVPVHDLGFDDSGRPFYVMAFVQGRTLKAAIEAYFAAETKPEQRQVERVRLLKIFLDVCNAVAYAHSRGIIHRDLKPDNIMLGPFGETVLLDWGLAKLKGSSEVVDGAVPLSAPPALSGSSVHTEDGSIMGSPLYMPPEMAQGHIADADQRTDVYLLGSTLYEILTGRPPRQGASREEILEMARTAPPVSPRKIERHTPKALEAICLRAMARDKSLRYESATQLADDIQRFIAGEPVSAYDEPLLARAWRWGRRHQRQLGRAAAAMIILGCATAAILLYHAAAQANAREQARLDVQRVRFLVDESHYFAASVDPPGEVAPYYDVGRSEQSARAALAAAQRWGPALDDLPLNDQRQSLRRDLSDLCRRLAGLGTTPPADAAALLERADLLCPTASGTPSAHGLFLQAETARTSTGAQAIAMNDADARRLVARSLNRAIELYQASLRQEPSDYWAHFQLARCYLSQGRGPEAVESFGACVALRPEAPWAYSARGSALALLHRFDQAKLDLDRALALDPGSVAAQLNRGIMYRLQDRPADAAATFDSLLAGANPPPEAAIYRGQLFLLADDPASALRLFAKFSSRPVCLLRAQSHLRQGQSEEALRDLDAVIPPNMGKPEAASARGHLLRCIATEIPIKDQKPALDLAVTELTKGIADAPSAGAFADLGAVLYQQGRYQQALDPLTRAIALALGDPQPLINRAWVNEKLDHLDAARSDFAAALRVSPDLAEALSGLGYIAARAGNAREAQLEVSLALANGGNDYRILHNVACTYAQLSQTDRANAAMHQQTAVNFVRRALDSWRRGWGGPHELDLIRVEVAFPPDLRERADFKNLLANPPA